MKARNRYCILTALILSCISGNTFGEDNSSSTSERSALNIQQAKVIVKECKPTSYPVESIKRAEEGKVQVKLLIDTTGKPRDAIIFKSSGHERLDKETVKYFYSCKFNPATENSAPINAWQVFEYNWRIEKKLKSPAWKE